MSAHVQTHNFRDSYRQALANPDLRQTLSKATAQFVTARKNAASDLGEEEWERLRDSARRIKDHTLAHVERYLKQFSTNVERVGGHVYWAASAADANRYIAGIAAARHVRLVVKSKSMVTEEIELNRALAQEGIEAVETDLGEYIIQLANERPSHVIAPAIHKTRRDVASLFSEKLKLDCPDEIEGIAALARRVLRERFASAGIGITGVNFAVAETGTLVLIENEGNIRMTTSLPPVHIAVMGIEKVIPRFADVDVFLKLLPRSGTGQRLTSYQSFITGVKKNPEDEGPEEVHVVVLDNGRSRMLAHPLTRQSLACIRCGACLNACPVYQQIGGHAYGSVYPGPIGSVITPQLIGLQKASQLPYASSLCGACREVCPVKIDIPRLLLHLRAEITEQSPTRANKSIGERLAFKVWAQIMTRPGLYTLSTRLGRIFQGLFVREGKISDKPTTRMFTPLAAWTAARDLRPLDAISFRDRWSDGLKK